MDWNRNCRSGLKWGSTVCIYISHRKNLNHIYVQNINYYNQRDQIARWPTRKMPNTPDGQTDPDWNRSHYWLRVPVRRMPQDTCHSPHQWPITSLTSPIKAEERVMMDLIPEDEKEIQECEHEEDQAIVIELREKMDIRRLQSLFRSNSTMSIFVPDNIAEVRRSSRSRWPRQILKYVNLSQPTLKLQARVNSVNTNTHVPAYTLPHITQFYTHLLLRAPKPKLRILPFTPFYIHTLYFQSAILHNTSSCCTFS